MPERKKKVLINTNFCKLFTGFGKNAKNLLKFLHKTGKYELIEYAAQTPINHPDLNLLPWKAHGTLPISPHEVHMLNSDPAKAQRASYGEYYSEEVIKKYSDSIFNMKQRYGKVLSHTTVKQVVKVKEVLVPYDRTDTLTVRDTLKLTYTTASIDTAGLHASLEVKEDGILIKDISLQNRLDIRVVVNKGGFFKKKQTGGTRTFYKRKSYEVQTRNTSPFFHTDWQTSYTFSPKSDVVTPVVIGFIGGLLIK